jgi:uncharacterized membrane protein YidH (DUF202 family)
LEIKLKTVDFVGRIKAVNFVLDHRMLLTEREFLAWLKTGYPLKKDSAAWSK